MTDSADSSNDLDAVVAGELERLKKLPVALLQVLGRTDITRVKRVGDQSYEIRAWSEPVTGSPDSFVVLVGALEPGLANTSHLHGFLVKPDQTYTELSESALRSYDEP
jgi:hypothetical protein